MGVSAWLADQATRAPHVLTVEVPGWSGRRMDAEATLRRRGWRPAQSPADADVLLVCGIPGHELRRCVDRVWEQLPGPRTRVDLTDAERVDDALDVAVAVLRDRDHQGADALRRTSTGAAEPTGPDESPDAAPGHDPGSMGPSSMDPSSMDMGSMAMGSMDMPMPGGIPLAGDGADRDGLNLDVLHLPLGPVLPHWPAGLVVECVLQGDVVTSASVRLLASGALAPTPEPGSGGDVRVRAACSCDSAARLLAVAGWGAASAAASAVRDGLRGDVPLAVCAGQLASLRHRVRRSRSLATVLGGVGRIEDHDGSLRDADARLASRWWADDAAARLQRWLAHAHALAEGVEGVEDAEDAGGAGDAGNAGNADFGADLPATDPVATAQTALGVLPAMLAGHELSAVRLIVASLDPDTGALAAVRVGADGGAR